MRGQQKTMYGVLMKAAATPLSRSCFRIDSASSISRSVNGLSYNDEAAPTMTSLHESALGDFGASSVAGHGNMQPFLAMYFIIALTGIFPSRS